MKYEIEITQAAERDIDRAADHIEFVLKNPQAAYALLDEAEKEIASLSDMPERYGLADDPLLAAWGIRYINIRNYLAFYTVDKSTVCILRFLYGKSDWATILKHKR